MIRWTTAQFKFKLPYTKSELAWATIKFWQNTNSSLLPVYKRLEHCESPSGSEFLYVSLTPEETARFSDKYKAWVQIRAQHAASGLIYGSRPKMITVYPMQNGGDDEPVLPPVIDEEWIVFDGGNVISEVATNE